MVSGYNIHKDPLPIGGNKYCLLFNYIDSTSQTNCQYLIRKRWALK